MFGRGQKKEWEELKKILSEFHQDQKQQEKSRSEALDKLGKEVTGCRELADVSGKNTGRQLMRLSDAIEDLLDERKATESAVELYERQIKENAEREKALIDLVCRYQEEINLIEERLANIEQSYAKEWLEQLSLFEHSLETALRHCAIEKTGIVGEVVDYQYHETLDVQETEKAELNGTVAYCYKNGCVYHGKVITKAQIRAYRRKNES